MGAKPYPAYKDSGVEWIGDIPEHWEVKRLRNLVVRRKLDPLPDDKVVTAFRDGQVTQRELRRAQGYTESDKEIGYQHVEQGDLVIHGMDAFAGAMGIAEASGKCSPVCLVCIPKPTVQSVFIGLSVRNIGLSGYIWSLAKGIRERSCEFRWNDARQLPLAFPPLEEQKQIASFLDRETSKIDTLIEKQQQLINLLKEKRGSLISHTVTKGLNPNAPMKDSGVEWIGDIPEHWEVKRFQFLVKTSNAGEVIDKSYWYGGGEVLFTCQIDPIVCEYSEFPSWKRTTKDDVLVTRNATPYVHLPPVGSIYSNVVQRCTLHGFVNKAYLHRILLASSGALQQEGYGVSIPSFSYGKWRNLLLTIPPLEEQKQIASFLDCETSKIDTLIDKANQSIALLKERRSSLISAAVTGKIDVREAA